VKRAVQTSLLPELERPIGPIPGSVQAGTNADLIATIAPLYLTGSVLDVTYGRGMWWRRFTPEPFVFHDIATVDGVDFRDLPHANNTWDTVCFDPPYLPQGGASSDASKSNDFRARFGLQPWSKAELDGMICDGLAECARVARRWVLVKCCDYVNGGAFHLGHLVVLRRAEQLGVRVHDLIIHHAGSGPGGHQITEIKRARRHHSYLVVLEVRS